MNAVIKGMSSWLEETFSDFNLVERIQNIEGWVDMFAVPNLNTHIEKFIRMKKGFTTDIENLKNLALNMLRTTKEEAEKVLNVFEEGVNVLIETTNNSTNAVAKLASTLKYYISAIKKSAEKIIDRAKNAKDHLGAAKTKLDGADLFGFAKQLWKALHDALEAVLFLVFLRTNSSLDWQLKQERGGMTTSATLPPSSQIGGHVVRGGPTTMGGPPSFNWFTDIVRNVGRVVDSVRRVVAPTPSETIKGEGGVNAIEDVGESVQETIGVGSEFTKNIDNAKAPSGDAYGPLLYDYVAGLYNTGSAAAEVGESYLKFGKENYKSLDRLSKQILQSVEAQNEAMHQLLDYFPMMAQRLMQNIM